MKDLICEFPVDSIIAADEWYHLRYSIRHAIETCDYEEAAEFYLKRGIPFLRSFEVWLERKLTKYGFKKEFIKDEICLKGLIHTVNKDDGTPYRDYRWDLNPPFGFPKRSYRVSDDNHTLWFKPDVEAALQTLESIRQLKKLLINNGAVNTETVKVYLRSFEMTINMARSGYLPKLAQMGENESEKQAEIRSKRDTWNGQTRDQLSERNQKIIEHYQTPRKTNLSPNGFAQKYAAKYGLKPRQIRTILKKAVGTLPG